jgi:hypothetical protein
VAVQQGRDGFGKWSMSGACCGKAGSRKRSEAFSPASGFRKGKVSLMQMGGRGEEQAEASTAADSRLSLCARWLLHFHMSPAIVGGRD